MISGFFVPDIISIGSVVNGAVVGVVVVIVVSIVIGAAVVAGHFKSVVQAVPFAFAVEPEAIDAIERVGVSVWFGDCDRTIVVFDECVVTE